MGGQFTRKMKKLAIEEENSKEITENCDETYGRAEKTVGSTLTETQRSLSDLPEKEYHGNKRTQEGITKGVEFFDKHLLWIRTPRAYRACAAITCRKL